MKPKKRTVNKTRRLRRATSWAVPQDQQNYEVIVCTIIDGELKTLRENEDLDIKQFCKGSTYQNVFRVYANGLIAPSCSVKSKTGVEDEAERQFNVDTLKVKRLLTEQFDSMYPEVAKQANHFTSVFTQKVTELQNELNLVADESSDDLQFDDKSLIKLLDNIESEYLRTGNAQSMVGWGLRPGVVAMFEIGLSEWKYRHARAISEVAKNVGAKYLVFVNEVWVRDPETGKRNGQDGLTAMVIAPDGSVLYSADGKYQRNGKKIEVVRPIKGMASNVAAEHSTQHLFPAWATPTE